MALTKCKECGREVSKNADACPGCGDPMRAGTSGIGCGGLVVAALVFMFIYIAVDTSKPPTAPRARDPLYEAKSACRLFIQHELNDPDSAKFEPLSTWAASIDDDGRAIVAPRLRAKNAFGGLIYSVWSCEVQVVEDDVLLIAINQVLP